MCSPPVLQKKVIDTQLEGFPIGRYTISPEVANGLYPNLVRFFQYGDALVKQRQLVDDKSKMGNGTMGPSMKMANVPQVQSNQMEVPAPLGRTFHQGSSQGQQESQPNAVSAQSKPMQTGGSLSQSNSNQLQQQNIQQMQQQAAQMRQQQFLAKITAQKQMQQLGSPMQRQASLPPQLTGLQDLFADPTEPSPMAERSRSSASSSSPKKVHGVMHSCKG